MVFWKAEFVMILIAALLYGAMRSVRKHSPWSDLNDFLVVCFALDLLAWFVITAPAFIGWLVRIGVIGN